MDLWAVELRRRPRWAGGCDVGVVEGRFSAGKERTGGSSPCAPTVYDVLALLTEGARTGQRFFVFLVRCDQLRSGQEKEGQSAKPERAAGH